MPYVPRPHGDAEIATTTQVQPDSYHSPGAALETAEDAEAREAVADEPAADSRPDPAPEYAGIDTRTPEGNLASRSNIVSDGPGTVQS